MSWTPPITWVHGSVYHDTDLNAQIRDNLLVLKTSIDNSGKFRALSSAYLANLSGTNLTGVMLLGSANSVTAKNVISGTNGRLVIPVDGSYAGTDNGDIAIQGVFFYYKNNAGSKFKYQGNLVKTPGGGAISGSVWIDSDGLHYVDASGDERLVIGSTTSMHSDAAALAGSLWMVDYVHWIVRGGSQEYYSHGDVHSDVAHSDSHTDTHSDVAHVDSHTDSHSDSHSDTAHSDVAHGDSHADNAHVDHSDVGHADVGHFDSHTDSAHSDAAHADSHSDVAHGDSHTDTHTDSHTDTHSDAAHADSHTDQPTAG